MRRHVPATLDVETADGLAWRRVDGAPLPARRPRQRPRPRWPRQLVDVHRPGRRPDPTAATSIAAGAIDTLTDPGGRGHRTGGRALDDHGTPVPDEAESPVPEWLTVQDPGLAIAWLTDLVVWVPRVWLLYPGSAMPACWPGTRRSSPNCWSSNTPGPKPPSPARPVPALAQWHDRWRPTATVRVTKALTGCERGAGCHVNPAGHHFTYDLDHLEDLAVWWATQDRHDVDAAPGLTRERNTPATRPAAAARPPTPPDRHRPRRRR